MHICIFCSNFAAKLFASIMASQKYTKLAVAVTLLLTGMGTAIGAKLHCLHLYDILLCITGVLAITYIVYFVTFISVDKIRRDVILVKKNYWVWVMLLVIAVPFAFSWLMLLCNMSTAQLLDESNSYGVVYAEGDARAVSVLWSVFFHYLDAGNQHISSSAGRALAAVLSICGIILFNGLLVSTILSWTTRRKDHWDAGLIRYPLSSLPKNRYAVVIGANEMVVSVVKSLLQECVNGERVNDYVVLQTSSKVSEVRERLSAHLSDNEMDRVICYNALRESRKEIQQLYLAYATEIYILGESAVGEDMEAAHDALNMHCLNLVAHELYAYKNKVGTAAYEKKVCRVMFDYQTTCSVFQFSDVATEVRETMVFSPFNMYESWARKVLVENQAYNDGNPIVYTPLEGNDGIRPDDDKRVHLVVIGMSKMGVAIAERALYQAHYLNYAKHRSRITFIDSHADCQMALFKGQHATLFELMRHRYVDMSVDEDVAWVDPMAGENSRWAHLSDGGKNFIDVEVEFVKGAVESDAVRKYLCDLAGDGQSRLTIAVCLNHADEALAASLYMPSDVYASAQLQDIWVYQRDAVDMVANLTDPLVATSSLRYKKLRPFGMLMGERVGDGELVQKAMLVNAAYDVICYGASWPQVMGDMSDEGYKHALESWERLMVNKKWSNCYFVDSIAQKIRSVRGDDACVSIEDALKRYEQELGESEHNRWNMEQLMMGYTPCGKADDEMLKEYVKQQDVEALRKLKNGLKLSAAKVHPNICDYAHLDRTDPAAKAYDIQLIYAIPKMLELVKSDR